VINPEKFYFMMRVHFPSVQAGKIEDLRCEICEDLKGNHCPGKNLKGASVVICMMGKSETAEFHKSNSLSSMH
jgi:hypothetical protein